MSKELYYMHCVQEIHTEKSSLPFPKKKYFSRKWLKNTKKDEL